jgi:Icc-related predicted phosphoesterase
MRIVATSDLHGYLPEIPKCDLLLIAGDLSPIWCDRDMSATYDWFEDKFYDWIKDVPARYVVAIAGNHDFFLEKDAGEIVCGENLMKNLGKIFADKFVYLKSQVTEFEGLKIWGSPFVPNLPSWAFPKTEEQLANLYASIPSDVDIVMTHGPAKGILDNLASPHHPHVGSTAFREWLLSQTWGPKLVVAGHIHKNYGWTKLPFRDTLFMCASHMNEVYDTAKTNPPIVIDYDGEKMEVVE